MDCNYCKTQIPEGSRYCPACGREVIAAPPPLPPTTNAVPNVIASNMPLAGVFRRCIAAVIDTIALFTVGYFIALIFGQTYETGYNLKGIAAMLFWFFGASYYIYFEGKLGATPGKMVLDIRVVKTTGEPCDIKAAIIRTVCRFIDNMFLLGIILMIFSERKQRIGDRLANTLVIKK